MNSMFSLAFMSSPKWIECSWRALAYSWYIFSPPGKELCEFGREVDWTSQGSSRDVIDLEEREAKKRVSARQRGRSRPPRRT